MADSHALITDSFRERLAEHFKSHQSLEYLHEDEALELGRQAADAVLGPVIWRELLGNDRLDTTQVSLLLRISRQALHKRLKAHTLLGVPGRGTTWFPAWQFDMRAQAVRPVTEQILKPWAEMCQDDPDLWNERMILSWAATAQPELDDDTPEEWIASGRDTEPVILASRRAARAFAS
jgi:hypothetical protein